jgi:hypothetical protein
MQQISNYLINIDKSANKYPIISTAFNLFNLAQKLMLSLTSVNNTLKNKYFIYIENKKTSKCLLLLIPFVGNFIYYRMKKLKYENIEYLSKKILNQETSIEKKDSLVKTIIKSIEHHKNSKDTKLKVIILAMLSRLHKDQLISQEELQKQKNILGTIRIFDVLSLYKNNGFNTEEKESFIEYISLKTSEELKVFEINPLYTIIKDLCNRATSQKEMNKMAIIKETVSFLLIQKLNELLEKVKQNFIKELSDFQEVIQQLENFEIKDRFDSFNNYIEYFNEVLKNNLKLLTFPIVNSLQTENLLDLISVSLTYPVDFSKDKLNFLKEKINEQTDFIDNQITILEDQEKYQLSLLSKGKLKLDSFLTLEFNLKNDNKFEKNKSTLDQQFLKVPLQYPIELLDPVSETYITINNESEFINLKSKYQKIKSINERMEKCLPNRFPFEMPNLISESNKIIINDEFEFKQLLDAYSVYFACLHMKIKDLKTISIKKKKLREQLEKLSF